MGTGAIELALGPAEDDAVALYPDASGMIWLVWVAVGIPEFIERVELRLWALAVPDKREKIAIPGSDRLSIMMGNRPILYGFVCTDEYCRRALL